MSKQYYPINFSPFATNVLDCVGRDDLITRSGAKVTIARSTGKFLITIAGKEFITDDNIAASYVLNQAETGFLG